MKKRLVVLSIFLITVFLFVGCSKKVKVDKLSKLINKEVVVVSEDKENLSLNIIGDITSDEIKPIIEKIYQTSLMNKWKAETISINIIKDETSEDIGFYKDGLMSKIIIEKEKRFANVWTYDKKPSVPNTMNETLYSVNDAVVENGVLSVKLNIAEKDLSKVSQQINFLSSELKELNSDKEINEIIFEVNPNEESGFKFSTEYSDILSQKETIRLE